MNNTGTIQQITTRIKILLLKEMGCLLVLVFALFDVSGFMTDLPGRDIIMIQRKVTLTDNLFMV
jgi:hypothetical protein